jgi:putative transposase
MRMPRKNLIRSNLLPYHVTARANNQEWFTLPIEKVWTICERCLKEAYEKHKVEVISFVLMSNHYHLLVRTPEANLDSFMYEFNKRLAFSLKQSSGNSNHILGARYKWCLIQSQKYFGNCYRYIYQNPLRAKITTRCEFYPYSTLFYIYSNKPFSIPLFDQMGFKDPFVLNWLNEAIHEEEVEMIKKGLRRSELKEIKNSSRRLYATATHLG